MTNDGKRKMISVFERCLVFLVVASTRFYSALFAMPVFTVSDEVSSINIAARLAGYNWNEVVSNAGYYGIGYLFIYAPLYMLKLPAVLIYRLTVAGSGCVLGIGALVCYEIITKFFPKVGRLEKVLISTACGALSYASTYQPSMRNEEMLVLMCWLLTYNLLGILSDNNQRKYRIGLIVTCLYSLTLHARTAIFIVAIIIIAIFVRLAYKKRILKIYDYPILILGYAVISFLLKMYQNTIWTGTAENSSVAEAISKGANRFVFDWPYFKAALAVLFGNLYSAYVVSACVFGVAVVSVIMLMVKKFRQVEMTDTESKVLVAGLCLLIGFIITLGGLIFTWGPNVAKGFRSNTTDWFYHYKAFTYLRYPGSFLPPLFMCGLVYMNDRDRESRKAVTFSNIGLVILTIIWVFMIHPYQSQKKSLIFLPITYFNSSSEKLWILTFFFFLLVGLMWQLLVKNKRCVVIICALLTLFGTAERIIGFEKSSKNTEIRKYEMVCAGTDLVNYMSEQSDSNMDVYVVDTTDVNDHQNWYMYQLLCYDVHIIPRYPDANAEEYILFTNGMVDLGDEDVFCSQLDNVNFVYYKGDKYRQLIESYQG